NLQARFGLYFLGKPPKKSPPFSPCFPIFCRCLKVTKSTKLKRDLNKIDLSLTIIPTKPFVLSFVNVCLLRYLITLSSWGSAPTRHPNITDSKGRKPKNQNLSSRIF